MVLIKIKRKTVIIFFYLSIYDKNSNLKIYLETNKIWLLDRSYKIAQHLHGTIYSIFACMRFVHRNLETYTEKYIYKYTLHENF